MPEASTTPCKRTRIMDRRDSVCGRPVPAERRRIREDLGIADDEKQTTTRDRWLTRWHQVRVLAECGSDHRTRRHERALAVVNDNARQSFARRELIDKILEEIGRPATQDRFGCILQMLRESLRLALKISLQHALF